MALDTVLTEGGGLEIDLRVSGGTKSLSFAEKDKPHLTDNSI